MAAGPEANSTSTGVPGGGQLSIRTATVPEFVRLWRSGRWVRREPSRPGGPQGGRSGAGPEGPSRGPSGDPAFPGLELAETVAGIIAQVRQGGQGALCRLTLEFDAADLQRLEVSAEELESWASGVPDRVHEALAAAAERIAEFASHSLATLRPHPADFEELFQGAPGGAREVWRPLRRVGFYVPGGRAPYPSSVLMSVVPAAVAGVGEKVLCTPPRPDGTLDPAVSAAALIAGADRVFRLGGAQAVAAMALGAGEVPRVDKVVGPGNLFVTEAKKQLFGHVGLDGLAGPSEFLAVTDCGAAGTPTRSAVRLLTWQLLAQAEHDPDALVAVVLFSRLAAAGLAHSVDQALPQMPAGPQGVAAAALGRRGALLVAADLDEAAAAVEAIRPEHLWVDLAGAADARAFAMRAAGAAGAVFIGPWSPVALGDYLAGPSHVLPTGGSAAWASPLGVADFMRRVSLIKLSPEDAIGLEPAGTVLAEYEGFTAHARSIRCAAARARLFGGVPDDDLE